MTRLAILLIVCAILFLYISLSARSTFIAVVISVADGDSISVLRDNQPVRIRLSDIDAPEHDQAFGESAKRFLSRLVFRKSVTVDPRNVDRYGRMVARVHVGETDVNLALVQAGLAWWYVAYSHDAGIRRAEALARLQRVGLWNQAEPVPPWIFRHNSLDKQPTAR